MNEVLTEKLPVGRSTFHTLREQGKIYVDKTAQIYELAVQSQKFFFARPPLSHCGRIRPMTW